MAAPPPHVLIVPHLGLGDAMVLAGLVRLKCAQAAERGGRVLMPSKARFAKSFASLFGDLGNLDLAPVTEADDMVRQLRDASTPLGAALCGGEHEVLALGQWSGDPDWVSHDPTGRRYWPRALYGQAGVDPEVMRTGFSFARDPAAEAALRAKYPPGEFVLVHDDQGRDLFVDRSKIGQDAADLPVVTTDDPFADDVLAYAGVLAEAREFHCFDSCYLWLVELARLRPEKRTACHLLRGREDAAADASNVTDKTGVIPEMYPNVGGFETC